MFTHYLKIAFRNMRKYKTQSITGIFGLAFGLACFIPALYWLHYETSYDRFYPGAEHIYRIYAVEKQSGKVNEMVPGIVAKKMYEHFPAMEAAAVFITDQENCKTVETPHIRLRMIYTDSAFFGVFPQQFVSGDNRQPLQILYNTVLTETVAVRLFGDVEKAIGQQVQTTMNASFPPYTVTAVVKDPLPDTNLPFDAIIFHDMVEQFNGAPEDRQWTLFMEKLYVKFHPGTDVDKLAEQLRDFTSRLNVNDGIELQMLPVSDVRHRLNSDAPFTLNFIRIFVAAGILLLFCALFNFLNLYLDFFRRRLREFRLRAVHGATGGQLVRQMAFELACVVILALALSSFLIALAMPVFSGLLNITMETAQLFRLFAVCGASAVALIFLAGMFPLLRLGRVALHSPAQRKPAAQPALRRVAVVLQLAVSVVFIVAAGVVMMQMRFIDRKDPGFDRNGIIQLSGFIDISGKVQTPLIHELEAIPQVESVTDAYFEPQHNAAYWTVRTDVEWPGKPADEKTAFHFIYTDSRLAETFGLKMLAGEWWSEGQTKKAVLNEEAVRVMGLSEPAGAIIRMPSQDDTSIMEDCEVAGVVNDFHTLSLRNRIQPTVFIHSSWPYNILYIRVAPGQEREAIRRITAILPGINATLSDVSLTPIGELYDRLNRSEQAGLKMFSVLATVCLLISLFGIYAVATAATRRRRREIAIRKVSGAEVRDIIRLFFREYVLQVIIAGVIALPPVYIAMSRWLQGYAYRTDIPWWLLAGVIAGVVAVVLFTVLGQVLKAAGSNPAEVVKSE
jgi:putative ABC transport system permease protein